MTPPAGRTERVGNPGMKLHVDGAVRARAYGPGTGLGAVGRTHRGQAVVVDGPLSPSKSVAAPATDRGCATSAYPSVSLAHSSPGTSVSATKGATVRAI